MRDEALIHFHRGAEISAGIHIGRFGMEGGRLIGEAAGYLDRESPGRCVAGFCAVHAPLVEDVVGPPGLDWQGWDFFRWDMWFGRVGGVYLVDLDHLRVVQRPLYQCGERIVRCDFSGLPGRLRAVGGV